MLSCCKTTRAALRKNNKTVVQGWGMGRRVVALQDHFFLQKLEGSKNVGWNKQKFKMVTFWLCAKGCSQGAAESGISWGTFNMKLGFQDSNSSKTDKTTFTYMISFLFVLPDI